MMKTTITSYHFMHATVAIKVCKDASVAIKKYNCIYKQCKYKCNCTIDLLCSIYSLHRLSSTTPGITSLRASQLQCNAGFVFTSMSQTCPKIQMSSHRHIIQQYNKRTYTCFLELYTSLPPS